MRRSDENYDFEKFSGPIGLKKHVVEKFSAPVASVEGSVACASREKITKIDIYMEASLSRCRRGGVMDAKGPSD